MSVKKKSVIIPETTEQFDSLLKYAFAKKMPVFIKFTAEWCGPCQKLSPDYKKVALKFKDHILFLEVDIDKLQELQSRYKVTKIPKMIILKNGQQVFNDHPTNLATMTSLAENALHV